MLYIPNHVYNDLFKQEALTTRNPESKTQKGYLPLHKQCINHKIRLSPLESSEINLSEKYEIPF